MLLLDVTVVNVALPAIGAHLHLDRPTLTWVLTAYTLVFGGLMLLGGRLADLLGARQVMLAGLAVFTGASLLSGLATNRTMLLAGRAAQGISAALLSPSALSLVATTFTGSERNKALGIWAIGGAGSAIGVLVGGVLTSATAWRWIFFTNVPAGMLVLAVLPALVADGRTRTGRAMVDLPGALAVTAATGAAIYGLISLWADQRRQPRLAHNTNTDTSRYRNRAVYSRGDRAHGNSAADGPADAGPPPGSGRGFLMLVSGTRPG